MSSQNGSTSGQPDTFFEQGDFHDTYMLLDDIFYGYNNENPEWYGEEYLQDLRDLGINLGMDEVRDATTLRQDYDFLDNFSDEEINYMIENYGTQLNSLSDRVYAYQSGNLDNMSDYEKGIIQKYLDADLGARTTVKFIRSLNDASVSSRSKSFDDFVNNLIKEGYGDNILVGMSIKTMSMLSRIGIENGIKPVKNFSIKNLNEGSEYRTLNGEYQILTNDSNALQLDYGSFKRNMNDSNSGNWSVSSVLGYGVTTVMHEYGHHVENILFKMGSDKLIKGTDSVSTYGNTSYNEAFAESFASYCLGIEPNRGKEYHSNFKKLMKENGLGAFEGCVKKLK